MARKVYCVVHFVDLVFREPVLRNAKFKPAAPCVLHPVAATSALGSPLSSDVRHQWPIMEDVFSFVVCHGPVPSMIDSQSMSQRRGQVFLIGATISCCLGVMGQDSRRSPKQ